MLKHKIGSKKPFMPPPGHPKQKGKIKKSLCLTRVHQGGLSVSKNRFFGSRLREWPKVYCSIFSRFESRAQAIGPHALGRSSSIPPSLFFQFALTPTDTPPTF